MAQRSQDGHRIVWLAEPGENDFIIVMIPGGPAGKPERDYSHFGCAESPAVDAMASGAAAGCLIWPPRQTVPVVLLQPARSRQQFRGVQLRPAARAGAERHDQAAGGEAEHEDLAEP
jgi:hypothetical protein